MVGEQIIPILDVGQILSGASVASISSLTDALTEAQEAASREGDSGEKASAEEDTAAGDSGDGPDQGSEDVEPGPLPADETPPPVR